jgi:hypothetical protein
MHLCATVSAIQKVAGNCAVHPVNHPARKRETKANDGDQERPHIRKAFSRRNGLTGLAVEVVLARGVDPPQHTNA